MSATSPPLCIDVLEAVAPVFSLRLLASEVTALAILLNCLPFLGHEKWEALFKPSKFWGAVQFFLRMGRMSEASCLRFMSEIINFRK